MRQAGCVALESKVAAVVDLGVGVGDVGGTVGEC